MVLHTFGKESALGEGQKRIVYDFSAYGQMPEPGSSLPILKKVRPDVGMGQGGLGMGNAWWRLSRREMVGGT